MVGHKLGKKSFCAYPRDFHEMHNFLARMLPICLSMPAALVIISINDAQQLIVAPAKLA